MVNIYILLKWVKLKNNFSTSTPFSYYLVPPKGCSGDPFKMNSSVLRNDGNSTPTPSFILHSTIRYKGVKLIKVDIITY